MSAVAKPAAVAPKPKPSAAKPKTAAAGASHPPYFEMIKEAIAALKDRTGSSSVAIAKYIEEKHGKSLPANFKKTLSVQLRGSAAKGKLVKVKASYKLSDAAKKDTKPAAAKAAAKPAKDASKAKKAKKDAAKKPKKAAAGAKAPEKKPTGKAKKSPAAKAKAKPKTVKSPAAKKARKVAAA